MWIVGIDVYILVGFIILALINRDGTVNAEPEDTVESIIAVILWPLLLVAYWLNRRRLQAWGPV